MAHRALIAPAHLGSAHQEVLIVICSHTAQRLHHTAQRLHRAARRAALPVALAVFAAVPLADVAAQSPASSGSASIRIPFQKYTLPNGLTVVLSEDHSTPTVAVVITYHVGSKNEVPGHTGFAHMFEHVMFTGSGHAPYGLHDKYTGGVGGMNNAGTWSDGTQYYETIPSNYLETALWLESDRMGFLLDSLDQAKFAAQRDVVQNERRERIDNQPNGRNGEIIDMTMFPPGHPYSWQTIGSMSDLKSANVEDVKNFFRLYYAPNNATLAIAGDFDPAQAKSWVAKYFTDISRGRTVVRPKVGPSSLTAEKRITFEDHVQIPQLTIVWPSADMHSADQPALDLLSDILGSSRTARLTKSLVYDTQTATHVSAFQNPSENIGEFQVSVTPRPGHSLTELETQVDSIVAGIKRDGPTADEMERVKAGQQAQFLDGLQSNLGKAAELANDQTFFDDPSYTFRVQYPQTQKVTATDIQRVANKYLGNKRVVLSTVPVGKTDMASHADRSRVVTDPYTEKTTEVKP